MTLVNLIYQNRRFQINIESLKRESEYFNKQEIVPGIKEIKFRQISEFEKKNNFEEKTITQFIEYFNTSDIEINNNNVFDLQFLSHKYKIQRIINKTDEYIKTHYKELIEELFKKNSK